MQMILGAPYNYVECPLQPEHLQFLLWRGGGPADNEVSGNGRFQIRIEIVLFYVTSFPQKYQYAAGSRETCSPIGTIR